MSAPRVSSEQARMGVNLPIPRAPIDVTVTGAIPGIPFVAVSEFNLTDVERELAAARSTIAAQAGEIERLRGVVVATGQLELLGRSFYLMENGGANTEMEIHRNAAEVVRATFEDGQHVEIIVRPAEGDPHA